MCNMQKMLKMIIGSSSFAFCIAVIHGANVGKPNQVEKPKPIVTKVSFSEVKSGKTKIVGRLGIPIGDVAVISGKWKIDSTVRAKISTGADFVVDTVNGQKLSADIIFRHVDISKFTIAKEVHEKNGLIQTLLVYESITFEGIPDAVFDRHGVPKMQADRATGYYCTLNIVRVEKN